MFHSPDLEVPALLQAIRDGNQAAARVLVDRYWGRLLHVVRKQMRLHPRTLRTLYDAVDFVQDTFARFLTKYLETHTFETPEQVQAFLVKTALSRVVAATRNHSRDCRNDLAGRCSLDEPALQTDPRLVSSAPSPHEQVQADEILQGLLKDLPAHHQGVILLRHRGHTVDEIAALLRLGERTVRRVIELTRPLDASSAP
jgi:RNA polymerase sigma factor (sigma-70 family)